MPAEVVTRLQQLMAGIQHPGGPAPEVIPISPREVSSATGWPIAGCPDVREFRFEGDACDEYAVYPHLRIISLAAWSQQNTLSTLEGFWEFRLTATF